MPIIHFAVPGSVGGCVKWSDHGEQLGPQRPARRRQVRATVLVAACGKEVIDADVAIIGGGESTAVIVACCSVARVSNMHLIPAGIIGLAAAFSLLQKNKKLSVALIESNHSIPAPAIGSGAATGAGERLC